MNKQNIAICGLRYGKTKHQAEQIKKYIEENNLSEIKITIVDSESKQKLDKIKEYITHTNRIPRDKVVEEKILSIIGGRESE